MCARPTCTRRQRRRWAGRNSGPRRPGRLRAPGDTPAAVGATVTVCPHSDGRLTGPRRHGLLRTVTDTSTRLWRRVHMDLVRYAGCVCRPSC
ncbi:MULTISPECIES: putative leader peptide [Streptomyces]|uniref:putative leader peptide n=1 Tax=Streptomyces TaxID=1883 RepID=UPI00298EF040|nr:putative leader peptide [Streptomyces scabiei]MDW8476246.1 putative leader peptide [Streptomyces scabiei]